MRRVLTTLMILLVAAAQHSLWPHVAHGAGGVPAAGVRRQHAP